MDYSKCKNGSWYWVKYNCLPEYPATWLPAVWDSENKCFVGYRIGSRIRACVSVESSAILDIGHEIIPPSEPNRPGIYRAKYLGDWHAAEFNGRDWMIVGISHRLAWTLITAIGDYLGPIEQPEAK